MEIAAMSVALKQGQVQQQAAISVMKLAMESASTQGGLLVELLKGTTAGSVQPHLGSNIDIQA